MKKHYWLLTAIVLGACSQSEFNELTEEKKKLQESEITLFDNGTDSPMLRFSNTDSFLKTFNKLLNKNGKEQTAWAASLNTEALLANIEFCEDSIMLSTPKAFQALFNKQLKVQVNDSLLQYSNGILYLTAIDNKAVDRPIECGKAESLVVNSENVPQTRQIGEVALGRYGMNHQYEFNYSRTHKYVHEFRSVIININEVENHLLIMNLKLEFDRGGWKQARDPRNITIDLNLNVHTNNLSFPHTQIPLNNKFQAAEGIIEIPIARFPSYLITPDRNNIWVVACTGIITHQIVGESATFWKDMWQ